MAGRDDRSKQVPGGLFNNPFGALKDRAGDLPKGPAPRAAPAAPAGPARAVVRYERKGHGGKEVTVVEKLELRAKELEAWLKELKQKLGCGGVVDGDRLQFQGDQRERLPKLLEARGVKKVTVS